MSLIYCFILESFQITSFHDYIASIKTPITPKDDIINKVYSDVLTSKFNNQDIVNEMYSKALRNSMSLYSKPEGKVDVLCDAETVRRMILLMNIDQERKCDESFGNFINSLSKSLSKMCLHNTVAITEAIDESITICTKREIEPTELIIPKTLLAEEFVVPHVREEPLFETPCPSFRPLCSSSMKMPLAKLLIKYDQNNGLSCPSGNCSLSLKTKNFLNHERNDIH